MPSAGGPRRAVSAPPPARGQRALAPGQLLRAVNRITGPGTVSVRQRASDGASGRGASEQRAWGGGESEREEKKREERRRAKEAEEEKSRGKARSPAERADSARLPAPPLARLHGCLTPERSLR